VSYVRLLCFACVLAISACAQVQPWERGELAVPTMAWEPDPLRAGLDGHVYASKEASTGGAGLAGGGCGCN
jgi:hypothetical protein